LSYPELGSFRIKAAPVMAEFRDLAGKEVVIQILEAVAEYRENK